MKARKQKNAIARLRKRLFRDMKDSHGRHDIYEWETLVWGGYDELGHPKVDPFVPCDALS
jgi:hypothetical protein